MSLGKAQVNIFTVNVPYQCGVLHSMFAQKFLEITLEKGRMPYCLSLGGANHVSTGNELFSRSEVRKEGRTELKGVPCQIQTL